MSHTHNTSSYTHNILNNIIETIRLFMDCADFSGTNSPGWDMICSFIPVHYLERSKIKVALWERVVQIFAHEMKDNFDVGQFTFILSGLSHNRSHLSSLLTSGSAPKGCLNDCNSSWGITLLYSTIYAHTGSSELLLYGIDPNYFGMGLFLYQPETPTSLSMYSSEAFQVWLDSLSHAGIDMATLLDREMERGSLRNNGWTRETLQRVCDWKFESTRHFNVTEKCSDCCGYLFSIKCQPLWLQSLDEIKRGRHPNKTEWALRTSSDNGTCYNLDIHDVNRAFDEKLFSDPPTKTKDVAILSSDSLRTDSKIEKSVCQGLQSDLHTSSPYGIEDIVHLGCWKKFCRTGTRPILLCTSDDSDCEPGPDPDTDDLSEHEFSPFLIHT